MNRMKLYNKRSIVCLLWMLMFTVFTLTAQQQTAYTMKGTVYDETGDALPGVSVYLKNKPSIGTATDNKGEFTIRAERGDMLVFKFIGYEDVEYLVTKEEQDLKIRFAVNAKQLDEVIISALGQTTRKISSVAAITSVEVKDLQVPVSSIANLLGGRVAGIISMQASGEPGKNIAEFWIRGISTFGANSSALVLVDGLEGDLNAIDPADVESFAILKDASATAVYGVRGANGVVLVNTKRGQTGKLTITGRASVTLSHLTRIPKYLRAYDYAKLVNEAMAVRNELPVYSPVEMDIIRDGSDLDIYPDVSWQDEILRRNSWKKNYYASANGGAQVAKYFVSLGASQEDAAYKYDKKSVYSSNVGYNTYTYRLNLDLELSPSTKLYFGSDGWLGVTNSPGGADTNYIWEAQAMLNPLLLPVRYSNGQFPAVGTNNQVAPTTQINYTGRKTEQIYKGKATMALNQDFSSIVPGLKLKLQGAYDVNSISRERRTLRPAMYQAVGRDTRGDLITILRVTEQPIQYVLTLGNPDTQSNDQYRKYHFESNLTYERIINDVHRIDGLIYYYLSDEKKDSEGYTNLTAIPKRYQNVSGRFRYGFQDTYNIDFNFGYTGSENFQPGRQYGFFPSIAIGWTPSSYEFVKNKFPWVDLFKIRASYGTVGNDRITDRRFPYLTTMSYFPFNPWGSSSVQGVTESVIGADNLIWERAIQSNLGFDGGFLHNRLTFQLDFFNNIRDGIFQPRVQVPQYAGLVSLPYGNVGKMRTYGSDGTASYTHEINKEMSFTVRGNYTYAKNNVIDWEEANPKYPYQERGGYPLDRVMGLQALGLFKDDHDIETSPIQTFGSVMPGDIKYRDVNGDGRIDGDDRVPIGRPHTPILVYGLGGDFKYKKFTLGVLFKGTGNTDIFHVGYGGNGYGYIPFYNGQLGNILTLTNDPKNRWIPKDYCLANGIDVALAENPNAMFPRLYYGRNNNNTQLSDFYKSNSRYIRLNEVTLNYNMKGKALQKVKISSIDVQLIGRDLYVWDKIKIFDPEQARRNGNVYPIPATYAIQLYIHM